MVVFPSKISEISRFSCWLSLFTPEIMVEADTCSPQRSSALRMVTSSPYVESIVEPLEFPASEPESKKRSSWSTMKEFTMYWVVSSKALAWPSAALALVGFALDLFAWCEELGTPQLRSHPVMAGPGQALGM
ncbi:hypothetical protein NDU88_008144 [Pleurodeles waltl]|uniref:Uncharacterized protein n=1 Tax=Pleurodeles waltl TaxID=8319 RepID=A0AAV7VUA9_PLEWA|nr:hypothetical protein NDU88_008144 [Pleurodeles waltl]